MDDIRAKVDVMERDARTLLQRREQRSASSYFIAVATNVFASLFVLALFGAFVYLLHGHLRAHGQAAAAIHEQREWFRTTLSSIGDAVIATDTTGRVKTFNGVAQSLTGWTEDEALGRPLTEVFCIINEKTGRHARIP